MLWDVHMLYLFVEFRSLYCLSTTPFAWCLMICMSWLELQVVHNFPWFIRCPSLCIMCQPLCVTCMLLKDVNVYFHTGHELLFGKYPIRHTRFANKNLKRSPKIVNTPKNPKVPQGFPKGKQKAFRKESKRCPKGSQHASKRYPTSGEEVSERIPNVSKKDAKGPTRLWLWL